MTKGLCFRCHKFGHRANQCKEAPNQDNRRNIFQKKKMDSKTAAIRMQEIVSDLGQEEAAKLFEGSGFC
ncbi:hypothetical protein, partial [Alkalibacillus haloalkaliphilus]|uniref:hypothetical protein n=1 Tax=Alkalibacillus haloalkaliphilus TaxID=94136 RepID=UPI0029368FD7